jgi:DNA-binding GntR family transcriptional regulator
VPRYQQIARELKAAIVGGQYPVGARLPTEAELCDSFGISRFTAREAVRLLATAGLVTRRQRAGTVVIALPGEARYTPTLASLNDLQQYARDTEMRVVYVGRIALDRARARAFGAEPGAEWIHAVGIRHESATAGAASARGARGAVRVRPGDGRPFCVVRVFLNPLLAGIESRLRTRRVTIYSIIEKRVRPPDRARRAGPHGHPARRRGRRQPRGHPGRRGAADRAPLLRSGRRAAAGGRERASGRSLHLPDAAAQVRAGLHFPMRLGSFVNAVQPFAKPVSST